LHAWRVNDISRRIFGENGMAIKRILVPLDFSKESLRGLAYAREFAKAFGAELLLVSVIEPIYYATPGDMYVPSPNIAMLLDQQRRLATQQFKRIGADLLKRRQRFRVVVKTGSPAQVIADTARRGRADMIIMATHGRTGLTHMLMGSVAEKVVRSAPCPVLTVGHAGTKPKRRKKR
jgi:universal stress protein A